MHPVGVAFAWPIMGKHDVIHKPEVHNLLHCRQMRTEPRPRPQLTSTENFVKFGLWFLDMRANRHTDRPIHAHRNTPHPYQGQTNKL